MLAATSRWGSPAVSGVSSTPVLTSPGAALEAQGQGSSNASSASAIAPSAPQLGATVAHPRRDAGRQVRDSGARGLARSLHRISQFRFSRDRRGIRYPTLEATMIGEICSKPAVTAVADTTAQEAAHRMATKRVGALVVVDRDGRPRGVVTDRDITIHVVAAGKHPAEVQLGSLLHRRPVVIREDAGILDATKKLAQRGVRRLPVVNSAGKVVGIVSLDDLMILLGSELGHVASTLASELGRAKP